MLKVGTIVKVVLYGIAMMVPCGGLAVGGFHLVKKYRESKKNSNIVEKNNGEFSDKRRSEEGETDLQETD